MKHQTNNSLINFFGQTGSILLGMGLIGLIWFIVRSPAARSSAESNAEDAELDEVLLETFPASDAVAHY